MKNRDVVKTPEWINDLIVYEIATKGFTSPDGPESGTFKSLKSKMEYLHELGITGIWLAGNQLCHPTHFYNIWNQYACLRPDKLDPTLGTTEDFKEMIDEAHHFGIKVFLDVITHGVISDSSLVKEKPHWFKGGSWNMTDYDWFGNHKDLDEWWVNTWFGYVKDFGIDGFRLDVTAYRYDLWSIIRKKTKDIGHEIIIIHELWPGKTGATDFLQTNTRLDQFKGLLRKNHGLFKDLAGFMREKAEKQNTEYKVRIIYEDGTISQSHTGDENALGVKYEGSFKEIKTDQDQSYTYIEHRASLCIENVSIGKKISDIVVMTGESIVLEGLGEYYEFEWYEDINAPIKTDRQLRREGEAPTLKVSFPLPLQDGQYFNIQLSSHDCGWEGFPLDKNPYMAQGSRFVFGYGLMLAPAVPIFMSGEEFDANFVPLPGLSPKLFGGEDPGKGTWLYGSWVQWDQLKIKTKFEMLQDVKRMIRIRRQEEGLIHPICMGESINTLLKVEYESDLDLPAPYMYYGTGKMVMIAGNPNTDFDAKARFKMPEDVMKELKSDDSIKVIDLWNEKEIGLMNIREFEDMEWTILKDKSAHGGLLVLKIEKA